MSKLEKNAKIQAATELFLMNGGKINVIPPKKVKVRVTCSGRMKSANTGGGDAPKFNISSLYFQGDNSGASNA